MAETRKGYRTHQKCPQKMCGRRLVVVRGMLKCPDRQCGQGPIAGKKLLLRRQRALAVGKVNP